MPRNSTRLSAFFSMVLLLLVAGCATAPEPQDSPTQTWVARFEAPRSTVYRVMQTVAFQCQLPTQELGDNRLQCTTPETVITISVARSGGFTVATIVADGDSAALTTLLNTLSDTEYRPEIQRDRPREGQR